MTGNEPTPTRVAPAAAYAARTKYDEPGRAERYAQRSARRNAQEWRLVGRVLDEMPTVRSVLDVPCGGGRLAAEMLARGLLVRCADLSSAMRDATQRTLEGRAGFLGVDAVDLDEATPAGAERFDLVVCFRFFHHLPDEASRVRVLRALAARTRGPIVLSFHHVASLHQLARAARRLVTGRRGDRHASTVARLRADAREAGLVVTKVRGLLPYLRDLWVAVLERREPDRP